jgi:hypothetical protein
MFATLHSFFESLLQDIDFRQPAKPCALPDRLVSRSFGMNV